MTVMSQLPPECQRLSTRGHHCHAAPNTEGVSVKVEEVIGHNMLQVREDRGMSQAQLGEALVAYLGKSWSRQAVSAAEKGRRAFTAAELLALAHVLETTLYRLMTPPVSVKSVDMPAAGVTVSAKTLSRLALPTGATETAFEEIDAALGSLADILERVGELADLGKGAISVTHSRMADAAQSMAVRIKEEYGQHQEAP